MVEPTITPVAHAGSGPHAPVVDAHRRTTERVRQSLRVVPEARVNRPDHYVSPYGRH